MTWTALCDTPPSSRLLPEKVVAAASLAAVGDLGEGVGRVGGAFSAQWRRSYEICLLQGSIAPPPESPRARLSCGLTCT